MAPLLSRKLPSLKSSALTRGYTSDTTPCGANCMLNRIFCQCQSTSLIRRAIPLKRAATEPSHLAVKLRCDDSCPASVHRITVSLRNRNWPRAPRSYRLLCQAGRWVRRFLFLWREAGQTTGNWVKSITTKRLRIAQTLVEAPAYVFYTSLRLCFL
jgi:hypothetical protein